VTFVGRISLQWRLMLALLLMLALIAGRWREDLRGPARLLGALWPLAALAFVPVLAGMAAAAFLVVGAVAAAADSLPDSTLYPIKGSIERVEGVFVFSSTDRFNFHLSLARTRLREAEAMFARHRVDLADNALNALEDELGSAADVVKSVKGSDPAVAGSLEQELRQAVETHDNQLAGLQGQVSNPTAVTAIARARDRAQNALQVAAAPADHGQGKATTSPSPTR